MDAEQFDAALKRWLLKQSDAADGNYHVQIKLWASEVEMAQLTTVNLPGWVIMDWQHRGLGLSARRATPITSEPCVARTLEAVSGNLLHAHVQIVLAPELDWHDAYPRNSLAPDMMPVIDAGHARILSVSAERDHGDWRIVKAHEPPNDENLDDF